MEMVSEHISYAQVVANKHNLPNKPNVQQLENAKYLAIHVDFLIDGLAPKAKKGFSKFYNITCFFRGLTVNNLTKGSSRTSLHLNASAIDLQKIVGSGITNKDIFDYIKTNLPFTELIWEFGTAYPHGEPRWVHYGLVKGREDEKVIKVATKVPQKDAKGQPMKDANGEPLMKTVYTIYK